MLEDVLQFPLAPEIAHVKFTVPANPSCDAILIAPLTVPPDLTVGNEEFALITKSGSNTTFKEKDCVFTAGAPVLDA